MVTEITSAKGERVPAINVDRGGLCQNKNGPDQLRSIRAMLVALMCCLPSNHILNLYAQALNPEFHFVAGFEVGFGRLSHANARRGAGGDYVAWL